MYRKIYSHANSIRVMMMMMIQHRKAAPDLQQIMQYKTKLLFPGTFL